MGQVRKYANERHDLSIGREHGHVEADPRVTGFDDEEGRMGQTGQGTVTPPSPLFKPLLH